MRIHEKIKALFTTIDKIDVHSKDVKGETPLMEACRQNLDSVAELLIKKGADTNTIGFMGDSPLIVAASNNNVALVSKLISAQANVNYYNEKSIGGPATALMQAAEVNAVEVAQILIDNNAEVNTPHSQGGMTALMFASKNNALKTADLLLQSEAKLEAKTFGLLGAGKTALCFAVIESLKEMVEFLLKKGAKAKPLRAIPRNEIPLEMVKWLKAKGAL